MVRLAALFVCVGVAPALLGFFFVHLFFQSCVDGPEHRAQLLAPCDERSLPIEARIVEHLANLFERQAEVAPSFDLLKTHQIAVVVHAIACRRTPCGQKPDRVVVVQRPHRHAGDACELLDLVHEALTYGLTLGEGQGVPIGSIGSTTPGQAAPHVAIASSTQL